MTSNDNALVVYEDTNSVRRDLDAMEERLSEVLPSQVDAGRFLRVAFQAITSNPTLMQCTRASLLTSISTAAQLGLEPSGLLGSAYLVPYRVNGRMVAQLIPGYRGLIDLARRSGEIDAIWANVVRFRDDFTLEQGGEPNVIHRPYIPDPREAPEDRDPGPYVGAYMVAVLQGGTKQVEWMSYDDIEAIRRRSKAATNGPWVSDWSEMARKTVVRRGSKYLPMTTDFRTALELDEAIERRADAPVTPKRQNKATEMLLEKAARRAGATHDAEEAPQVEDGPGNDQNGAPGPSEEPTGESQAQTAFADEPDEGDPTAVCGDDGGMLGYCTRMPGHTAAHQSAQGKWPQERKGRR